MPTSPPYRKLPIVDPPYPGMPESRGTFRLLRGKRPWWAGPPPPRESLRQKASRHMRRVLQALSRRR